MRGLTVYQYLQVFLGEHAGRSSITDQSSYCHHLSSLDIPIFLLPARVRHIPTTPTVVGDYPLSTTLLSPPSPRRYRRKSRMHIVKR
jgi:hypothetical protein